MKHKQILSVSSINSDSKNNYPLIRISGKWLNSFGFSTGDSIIVETTDSRIVIRKINFMETR